MRVRRLPAAVVLFVIMGADAQAASTTWHAYANARFGYSICYPANLMKPLPEAENGDGRVFKAADTAELRVFGTNNPIDGSLADEAKLQASEYLGRHGKVTYHRLTRSWDVTSGDDGRGFAFYNKTFQRGDQFVEFQFKYPTVNEARYKPVIERVSRCFTMFKPAF